jgi:predicted short-subunit dehydrogenase-like oxidoreductase (DUF2520 family)
MPNPETKNKPREKPRVSIIGPGRLGIAMGIALDQAGYTIDSIVGRRRYQLRKAASSLDVPCKILVAKELDKFRPAEVVIVAVADDRISEVAEGLEKIETRRRPTVLHTSGALSSTVFAGLSRKGWHTGSIHPLVSISDSVNGASLLSKAFWCVEGDAAAVRMARRLVRALGGQSFSIDSKTKPLYHAAAVMSSGNVTALFDVALDMLERCGLPRRKAQKILLPLLESTTTNLARFDPARALTGSFARGDLATVKMHLLALSQTDLDEALKLYRSLGEHALKLAGHKISREVVEKIRNELRD